MAVLEQEIVENQGLIKELDKDSMSMILDVVQKDIYSFPIESSVRENFSNAYDSVKEKKIALSILNKEAKVEDHFEIDDRIETKASIFDESYYGSEYLDQNNDLVRITYTVNEEDGKDSISFRDFGVGLGGERLKGYMRPGYSSKRLSKDMLGKYGLGSKSSLATNIEYYVLESWYNGYYTKFMIYDKYYKCILPESKATKTEYIVGEKAILNDEGEMHRVVVKEPIYWEDTTDKNGVKVSFTVKSHNKDRFVDAVKKQLMYFGDHLVFEIIENGISFEPSFKATILHETDLFLVSRNNYFSVPHILINNVNYSIIDFPELGMNKLHGSIAVKATSKDVDVAANREIVKWTDRTRNFIQAAIKAASGEAGNILESKLASIENPIERYLAATNYQSHDNDADLIKQLRGFGGIVRMNVNINPKTYLNTGTLKKVAPKGVPKQVSIYKVMDMFYKFKTSAIGANTHAITTAELRDYTSLDFKRLFFIRHEENTYPLRASMALYIQRKLYQTDQKLFQFMAFKDFTEPPMDINEFVSKNSIQLDRITNAKTLSEVKKDKAVLSKYRYYLNEHGKKGLYFELFAAIVKKYSVFNIGDVNPVSVKEFAKEIRLSEDPVIKQTAEQKKEKTQGRIMVATESEQDTRKRNLAKLKKEKQVLSYRTLTIRKCIIQNRLSVAANYEGYQTGFSLMDVKTADLGEVKGTVVYASTEDRALLLSVAYMYMLSINRNRKQGESLNRIDEDSIAFIQIAKDNIKFFKEIPGSMDVKTYIKQEHSVNDGKLKIKFGDTVRNFMTGLYLHKLISLNPVNRALDSQAFVELLKETVGAENVPMVTSANNILRVFPIPRPYLDGRMEDSMTNIKDNFRDVLQQDEHTIDSLMESLYGLSEIQNLPVEVLPEEQKAVVQKFNEVDVDVFDKVFIDSLDQELLKYREIMELVLLRYITQKSDLHYDKTNLYGLLDAQIQEKLVSL